MSHDERSAMTREEAIEKLSAYCDQELPISQKLAVEDWLAKDKEVAALCAEQQAFQRCCRNLSAVPVPQDLEQRLREALASAPKQTLNEQGVEALQGDELPRRQSGQAWRRRLLRWSAVAAVLMLVVMSAALWKLLHAECLYIVACTQEYRKVVSGIYDLQPYKDLPQFQTQTGCRLKALPDLTAYGLHPSKIGKTRQFHELGEVPDAWCIVYGYAEKQTQTPLLLILHPWPEETPSRRNFQADFNGWVATHAQNRVFAWKTPCGTLLCSIVVPEGLDLPLRLQQQLAQTTREEIRKAL